MREIAFLLALGVLGWIAMNYGGAIASSVAGFFGLGRRHRQSKFVRPRHQAEGLDHPVEFQPLTLTQARHVRDQLQISDPNQLALLYAMSRPRKERATVMAFIRPSPEPDLAEQKIKLAIDPEGEELDDSEEEE